MMRDTPRRGALVATAVVEDTDAPACTPPADRDSESEGGRSGCEAQSAGPPHDIPISVRRERVRAGDRRFRMSTGIASRGAAGVEESPIEHARPWSTA